MRSSEAPNQGSSQAESHSGASPHGTTGTAEEILTDDRRQVEKNSTVAETNIEKKTEASREPTGNPDQGPIEYSWGAALGNPNSGKTPGDQTPLEPESQTKNSMTSGFEQLSFQLDGVRLEIIQD